MNSDPMTLVDPDVVSADTQGSLAIIGFGCRQNAGMWADTKCCSANVLIERLWRSLKCELIDPGDFASGAEWVLLVCRSSATAVKWSGLVGG